MSDAVHRAAGHVSHSVEGFGRRVRPTWDKVKLGIEPAVSIIEGFGRVEFCFAPAWPVDCVGRLGAEFKCASASVKMSSEAWEGVVCSFMMCLQMLCVKAAFEIRKHQFAVVGRGFLV